MNLSSPNLRKLLTLTEKKDALLQKLAALDKEIAALLSGAEAISKTSTPVMAKSKSSPRTPLNSKPGGLKTRILPLLEDAGPNGLHVKDIADTLGVKAANISVWFSTTGKKFAQKVAPARFARKN